MFYKCRLNIFDACHPDKKLAFQIYEPSSVWPQIDSEPNFKRDSFYIVLLPSSLMTEIYLACPRHK